MFSFIVKRLLNLVILFFGITLISFFVIKLSPGSPAGIYAFNTKVDPQVLEKIEKHYGLDKPIMTQYFVWLKNILRLDFGVSLSDSRKVSVKILERMPVTLGINLISMFLIFSLSIPLGLWSGFRKNSFLDRLVTIFVFIGFAIPSFWIALILMELLGVEWGILPISGLKSIDYEYFTWYQKLLDISWHLILPIGVAIFGSLAGLSRYARSKTVEIINSDYIKAAKAKGLSPRWIISKHILRGIMLPIVTMLGLSLPGLLGGSVIFETIFSIQGMGLLFYEAVCSRDDTLIMGLLVIGAILTLLGNFLADISYSLVDPRIRYKGDT